MWKQEGKKSRPKRKETRGPRYDMGAQLKLLRLGKIAIESLERVSNLHQRPSSSQSMKAINGKDENKRNMAVIYRNLERLR